MGGGGEHAVEVVVAVGKFVVRDCAADGVAEAEHLDIDAVALGEESSFEEDLMRLCMSSSTKASAIRRT